MEDKSLAIGCILLGLALEAGVVLGFASVVRNRLKGRRVRGTWIALVLLSFGLFPGAVLLFFGWAIWSGAGWH